MKPLQLTGINLKASYYSEILSQKPVLAWLEVHSENYFGEGGQSLQVLEQIRKDYPISLHGVSLSIGSADELNWVHLKKLRDLIDRIDPCLISDHLSWSSINGQYLHDLLPLPFTEEVIHHIVPRIQQTQDYLKRQILIENVSSYLTYENSIMPEEHFLCEIANQSGCGILLDINNIYVNSFNHQFDAESYIKTIPAHLVQELHLAGFTTDTFNGREIILDSHNRHIAKEVWDLYYKAIRHLGCKPTIIEWDSELPTFETLYLEALRAETIMRESYVTTKHTS